MKILLLGAAGFIGTNLTIELAKKTEDEITLVDRSKAFFKPIVSIHLNSSVFVSSRIGSDESSTALSSNLWFGLVTWKRVVYLLGGRD